MKYLLLNNINMALYIFISFVYILNHIIAYYNEYRILFFYIISFNNINI